MDDCWRAESRPHRQRSGEHYLELAAELGNVALHAHRRAGTPEQKARAANVSPEAVKGETLAGEPIARG